TMDHDGSAVAISDAVKDKLPDLRKQLGSGAAPPSPASPLPVVAGPVQAQDLAVPLHLEGVPVVVDELEAALLRVAPASH
ncbi:hypothetical protein ABZ468_53370, partial [Streptomyces sp. NPDC005708]|uniref:hypothetical protein n=1 Tax=Streptomyces sp. NPDC005708 TaxID=3154564 RepID=UPI0033CFC73F